MSVFRQWTIQPAAYGFRYLPPEGRDFGAFQVREHVRPLEPFAALWSQALKTLAPTVRVDAVEPLEPLVTFEGELALVQSLSGTGIHDGRSFDYVLGVVCGDESYDRVDAYCTSPAERNKFKSSMRTMLLEYKLNLDQVRTRRFVYRPPAQWVGRGRGLRAEWYPRDYPRTPARLSVAPALPWQQSFGVVEKQLGEALALYGFSIAKKWPQQRISTAHGLNGVLLRQTGTFAARPATEVLAAALLDERFLYVARLETVTERFDDDRALLLDVVKSVQPVPAPHGPQTDILNALMRPGR